MPFRRILGELLDGIDGSIGAMFLDYEGETVELNGRNVNGDDLRIIGAYQGIFLDQLTRICDDMSIGTPQRLKLEFRNARILSCSLKDGYYAVVVIGPGASEGLAWHRLGQCREKLLAEM